MFRVQVLNPVTIRKIGLDALAKALGPIGMVRFLRIPKRTQVIMTEKAMFELCAE